MTAGKTNLGQLLNHITMGKDDNRPYVYAPVLIETNMPYTNSSFGCPYVDNTSLVFGQIVAATNSVPMLLVSSMGAILSQQIIDGTSFHPDNVTAAVVHRVVASPDQIKILIGGSSGDNAFIALFNGDSTLDKAIKLTPPSTLQTTISKVLYYQDNYYVIGYQTGSGTPMSSGFIMKLDNTFSVVASKKFGASTGTSFSVMPFDAIFNLAGQLVISTNHDSFDGGDKDIGIYVFNTSLTNLARVEIKAYESFTGYCGIGQKTTGAYIIAGRTPNKKIEIYSVAANLSSATRISHVSSGTEAGDEAEPRSMSVVYDNMVAISGYVEQYITGYKRQFVMYLDKNTLNPVTTMYYADDFGDSTDRSFSCSFVDISQRLVNIGNEGIATTILYTDPYGTTSGCAHLDTASWTNSARSVATITPVTNYTEASLVFTQSALTDISMTATTGLTTSIWCAY